MLGEWLAALFTAAAELFAVFLRLVFEGLILAGPRPSERQVREARTRRVWHDLAASALGLALLVGFIVVDETHPERRGAFLAVAAVSVVALVALIRMTRRTPPESEQGPPETARGGTRRDA